ncbi:MAG: hypothetical protein LBI05_02640 [Planctomycetaceae bacterium]|jgi:hypothetical protein|nr:hypothetical protein [Planctomycetaceae bacterium]
MAESYFELLTEQQGLPAKPFDPLGELRLLRRRLVLRLQNLECPEEIDAALSYEEDIPKNVPAPEPVSLESVVRQVSQMKKTLAIWRRSRIRAKRQRIAIFRKRHNFPKNRQVSPVPTQCLDVPKEGKWETIQTGLLSLGVIGVVFGILSFLRGWEIDLSLGSLVCASGATIVTIGITGLFLASHSDQSVGNGHYA